MLTTLVFLENYKPYYNYVVAILPTIAGIHIIYKTFIYHYSAICTVLDIPNKAAQKYPPSFK
jgi:hypothetical protein